MIAQAMALGDGGAGGVEGTNFYVVSKFQPHFSPAAFFWLTGLVFTFT